MTHDGRRLPIDTRTFFAILLALVLALLLQAAIAVDLAASGHDADHALALARLVTLPPLLALVSWLLHDHRRLVVAWFAPDALTARLLLTGIATGLLMRVAGWSQVTAFGAFGLLESARDAAPQAFSVTFQCRSFPTMAAAAATWIVLVPLTEEIVHRGVVLTFLARHGKWAAIGGSTLTFALLHEPGAYPWVALMGTVFALQFWHSRSLWLPVISHAGYDSLILLDELCLRLAWNPLTTELPVLAVGVPAAAVSACCTFAVFWLARAAGVAACVGPPQRSDASDAR